MKIVGSTSSTKLAQEVAELAEAEFIPIETKKFPDGEKYVKICGDVSGDHVAVICSMGHSPDEYLLEYLLTADALKDLGAKNVVSVFPYLAYVRQDERFTPGEAVSLVTVAKLIRSVGISKVYTIDSHRHRRIRIEDVFKIPVRELTSMTEISRYFSKNLHLVNPIVVAPDSGAESWAKTVAETLGCSYTNLEKRRLNAEEVEIKPRTLDIRERDALIIDDIISSGGTIIKAAKKIHEGGARRVFAACAHPLLSSEGLGRIKAAGVEAVIGTNTVQSLVSVVDVAPVIADALSQERS